MSSWLEQQNPYTQTLCGTLFTWGVTALGAAMIFVMPVRGRHTKTLLDCSLGFAAGIMLAASYWSLLAPAIEQAENQEFGSLSWLPVAVGIALGAGFVAAAGSYCANVDITSIVSDSYKKDDGDNNLEKSKQKEASFRRMLAMVVAITVHNIPEGMAVGVGFGGTNFAQARNLALGIGLQNFPEGLAVSLPLAAAGESKWKAFFWGQLSGFVEPIFGMLGVMFVQISSVLLPYALGFAAGAMIYVVMDDIVPDACSRNNASLAAKFSIVGFIVMMAMDVALG